MHGGAVLRSGAWFTPARAELDAAADAVQQQVTGVVRLKLFDGECGVGDVEVTASARTIVLAKAHD
jgi:argininosuccinate synthase